MYIDTLAYQTREFFYSLGFGFILGIFYFLTRIIRLAVYNGKKKAVIFDVLFSVAAAFLSVIFVLGLCRGKFAFYVVLGIAAGFAVFFFTIGNALNSFSEKISLLLRKTFSKIFKILRNTFGFFLRKTVNLTKFKVNFKKKSKNKSKKHLQEQ
ncbi:MAG: spore cortex biosynthesis protein YabQ [Clostridia bacterium]|nr:spore cortex biosynthesis protein YabQ [Clostridia bacterium]